MTRLEVLTEALAFIEARLAGPLSPMEVAVHCHYSLSAMQKMFRHAFHLGIADYIARRRITQAAQMLLSTQDPVLDIALHFGYESHEVFLRAFRRVWGTTPTQFRRERTFAEICPRLRPPTGEMNLAHRHYDITQFFDTLRSLDGTYALVFDTCHLDAINKNIGRAAGDLVIAECLRRIDEAKSKDMILFRIGGDEYVLLTGLNDREAADKIVQDICAHNDEPIVWEEHVIPVGLHSGITQLNTARRLNYAELFRALDGSIQV